MFKLTKFLSKQLRWFLVVVLFTSVFSSIAQITNGTSSDSAQVGEMLAQYINFDTTNTYQAEEQKAYIGLTLKPSEEGVILRWAPTTQELFDLGNELGYVIKRYEYPSGVDTLTIDEDNFIETWVVGPEDPVNSYDSARWASLLPIEDKYAIIAAGATSGSLTANSEMGFGVKAKQDKSMFGYTLLSADLSMLAADGLGFRFVDKNVRLNKDYEYRVILNDPGEIARADSIYNLDPMVLDSAGLAIWAEWMDEQPHNIIQYLGISPEPRRIQGLYTLSAEKSVELIWPKHDNPGFSAYFIERSEDGGRTYDSLTNNLYLSSVLELVDSVKGTMEEVYFYTDLLDTNYVEYTYRVTAYDAFADRSAPATVKGMGKDTTPPKNPEIVSAVYEENEKRIRISWHIPEIPADLHDIHFEYTEFTDSTWLRLEAESLDPNDTIYYHKPLPNEYAHYFRIAASDTANNISYSYPAFVNIPDTIPPLPPIHLKATIDTTGQVIVRWEDELPDKEGFLGFRVFASNSKNHEYTQLTIDPIEANFFLYRIPINTLTEKIHYKVQAVDKHYNHSAFSESIEASKPDMRPPVAPIFRSPKITEENVILSWAPSPSKDVDHYIITKTVKGGSTERILIDDISTSSYTDQTLAPGIKYYYKIVAVDDADLQSKDPHELYVKLVDKKQLESISNLNIEFNEESQEISLSWDVSHTDESVRYVIYRNVNQAKLRRHQLVEGASFTERVSGDGEYQYGIRVMNEKGARSRLSETVSITIR